MGEDGADEWEEEADVIIGGGVRGGVMDAVGNDPAPMSSLYSSSSSSTTRADDAAWDGGRFPMSDVLISRFNSSLAGMERVRRRENRTPTK